MAWFNKPNYEIIIMILLGWEFGPNEKGSNQWITWEKVEPDHSVTTEGSRLRGAE